MARESYATLRLPASLKSEVERIAKQQARSLSNTIELLLRRGVQAFQEDGLLLVDLPKATQTSSRAATESELAEKIAELVMAKMKQEARERNRGDGGHDPPKKSGSNNKGKKAA